MQVHYEILLHHQKISADTAYETTIALVPNFIEIYTEIQTASEEKKSILREQLQKSLKVKYEMLKRKGVLQYHFLLPNNISFLRMHKPTKFGKDGVHLGAMEVSFSSNDFQKYLRKFSLYTFNDMSIVNIISFYPVHNITNTKTLAWIVSYEKSDFIYNTLRGNIIVRIISFIIFLKFGFI